MLASVFYLSSLSGAYASDFSFNMLDATPIGSWQVRDNVDTNHKGKSTASNIRTSLLGSEIRDGKKHYWIEMVIDSFKIDRKGKRKPNGDKMIMKSLVPESIMGADPSNVMGNLRGFGVETIMQSGNNDPIRMSNTGGMMAGMLKSMNIEINYDFKPLGSEKISVTAGDFNASKVQGSGSTSAKILFKKIHVESNSTVWFSSKVPFGTVKLVGSSVTNGKKSTFTSELLEFGTSGAKSLITKEPTDMPTMPNIFGR